MDELNTAYQDRFLEGEDEKEALLALLLDEDGFDVTELPNNSITPRHEHHPAPLSFAQERLWFLDQFTPGLSVYNIPVTLHITGPLHIPALCQSIHEIVSRHEVLRTTFTMQDDQPVQVIADTSGGGPEIIDLRTISRDQKERLSADLIHQEAKRPFDLVHGPLFRSKILRLSGQETLLLLTMHHIISDGWSMSILYRELAACYEAFSQGQPSPLPPLNIQYADFATWQRNWLQEQGRDEHLGYWLERLKDTPALLNLPTDRPRPAIQTFSGAVESLKLSTQLTTALKELSQRQEVTLFMTLLAIWLILLWRYTEQDDICVGTFIAGRNHREMEQLIGFFINNLVLRTDMSGNPSFEQILERVRESTLGAYAHQDIPFNMLLQELGWKHTLSTTPLFQVMLILQNMPEPIPQLPGLTIHATGEWSTRAHFDLSLWVTETNDHLHMDLQYNTDLFDAETIQRLLNHLHVLIQGVIRHPRQHLLELPLLTTIERQQVLASWQTAQAEQQQSARCLHQLFEEQVEYHPDAVVLVSEDEQITYAVLNERANQLAHHLRSVGVGPETPVGICMPRCTTLIESFLGVLKAGGAYVPLDPSYPSERLSFMIEDAQLSVLLMPSSLLQNISLPDNTIICLDTDHRTFAQESASNPTNATQPSNLAYIMYTSGSTGRPKGVAVQHRSLVNYIQAANTSYGLRGSDRVLQFASISFDISVEEIYMALCHGATLVLRHETMLSSIPTFLCECQRRNITVLDLPTAFWHELTTELQATTPSLPSVLRLVIIGGERVRPTRVAAWQRLSPAHLRLVNTYGPTETTIVATIHEITGMHPAEQEVPIGRALTNIQVAIVDRIFQPTPLGVWGELVIGGAGLARGYLHHPALTAEKFIPDPFGNGARLYRSGDRARFRTDGTIEFGGRIDHQVKLRGFRVELAEIEATLRLHPHVYDAVASIQETQTGEKRLIGYIVWKDKQAAQVEELRPYLKRHLPEYMIPSAFVSVDQLPLLPNGKVDYRVLPSPEHSTQHSHVPRVAPRDALEQQLTQIWEECLQVAPIGIMDNFFDLGGHSLLAVRVLSQIQRRFSRALPLSALFEGATIAQLATTLRQPSNTHATSVLVEIQPQGTKHPLFLTHPTGGNVLCYARLAHYLGREQPVYGLQALGLDGKEAPLTTIEAMATQYIRALREKQPEGPYLLGGWSSGGLLAIEMASQLQTRGLQVGLLVLLDTPALFAHSHENTVGHNETTMDDAAVLAKFISQLGEERKDVAAIYRAIQQLTPEDRLLYVLEQAKIAHVVPSDADSSLIHRLLRVYKADVQATLAYRPQPYADHVTYIQCEQSARTNPDTVQAWRSIVTGQFELLVSPGEHFTMLKEPHVQEVAALIRVCLEKLQ